MKTCVLVGVPVHDGASQRGCAMGPEALRTARLQEALSELGYSVLDDGDVSPTVVPVKSHANTALRNLDEVSAWIKALAVRAYDAAKKGTPIFLGGDHCLSAGSVIGVAKAAAEVGKPLFVLWLDAHPDFHRLGTTESGNLHGTPVAYFTGQKGFDPYFPPVDNPVDPANICMMGLRSVDKAESDAMSQTDISLYDMSAIDEFGIVRPLRDFLAKVKAADGWLHVSLDVDFIEPEIAPAVGTTVPGGATFREAHLIMEMLQISGHVRSLDLVELNPFLDERGRTAKLLVDLTASLFGRRIIDRQTRSY